MAVSCTEKKLAGVIIDGACREVECIEKLKFPTFSAGAYPDGSVKKNLGFINVIIPCGVFVVNPGDNNHRRSRWGCCYFF